MQISTSTCGLPRARQRAAIGSLVGVRVPVTPACDAAHWFAWAEECEVAASPVQRASPAPPRERPAVANAPRRGATIRSYVPAMPAGARKECYPAPVPGNEGVSPARPWLPERCCDVASPRYRDQVRPTNAIGTAHTPPGLPCYILCYVYLTKCETSAGSTLAPGAPRTPVPCYRQDDRLRCGQTQYGSLPARG